MSSTNRGAVRNKADFYATPEAAFLPLLDYLPRDASYWEPCAGDGRLIRWLERSGRKAQGADLFPQSTAQVSYSTKPTDFLKDDTMRSFILTNPPFSLAQEFVTHALSHAPDVMMLLRLNFLGAQKRRSWWQDHEPQAIFVLSCRPDFTGGGGDSCEYGWFYWGARHRGIIHL